MTSKVSCGACGFHREQKEEIQQIEEQTEGDIQRKPAGNGVLRMKSNIGNIRYGMWKCKEKLDELEAGEKEN